MTLPEAGMRTDGQAVVVTPVPSKAGTRRAEKVAVAGEKRLFENNIRDKTAAGN